MPYIHALLVACAFAACTTVTRVAESRETVIVLLVPEAVRDVEPRADRILVLLGSGRIAIYEDAVLRRAPGQLVVHADPTGGLRGSHDIVDVRAVQLERTRVTTERESRHD